MVVTNDIVIINQELLTKQLIKAKKMIAKCAHTQDRSMIGPLEMLNQELCLVVANFECQKCKSIEKLQLHHLIMRRAKDFMDFWRYVSQRYYWANQVVLCQKCHRKYHVLMGKDNGEHSLFITDETIEKIKRKYRGKPNATQ